MFETLVPALTAWWQCQTAILQLSALDDRLLEDMGLAREEIAQRVAGPEPVEPAAASGQVDLTSLAPASRTQTMESAVC